MRESAEGVVRMKRFFKWFGIAFCAFLAVIAAMAFLGRGQTANLTISDVDLERVPDGTFVGTYEAYRFTNTVEVTVASHAITSIDVVKTQRAELSETLKGEVIAAQSTEIDVVSGASLDRNAFLKAVEIALTQAIDGVAQ